MLLILLNIVLPVFAISAVGYVAGRRSRGTADMAFINQVNLSIFCPALVFSALLANPVPVGQVWTLAAAGTLVIIVPGLLLLALRPAGMPRPPFIVPGMFRNTGNIGIPLMMLAYGREYLGDIILLFVISNSLHFSLGIFLLTREASRWQWLRGPNIWAALLGLLLAPHKEFIPVSLLTTIDFLGQITIPLMLFSLGVRLSQGRLEQVGLALRINLIYLLAGALSLPIIFWLLPLTPEWSRLIALAAMLPPAVLNFLLCERYRVEPTLVANVVLFGNVMSVAIIPVVIWLTLHWL